VGKVAAIDRRHLTPLGDITDETAQPLSEESRA
jgi:hypothetical protein